MTNTRLAEVYDGFLGKISDYTLLSNTITDMDINEELFSYFKSARAKFFKCRQSLKTVILVDEENEEYDSFEVELTDYEIEILVSLMLVEYTKPFLMSTEVIKQSLSDKDFKIYSQANQLRELRLLAKELKKEANKMISTYTYQKLDKENYK
ncbi:putative structural protein [Bacillus phage vB_BanS_Sophrita]|uniref:Structural protein n=2 Tax=Sophritavirus TaxID=3044834 RepID=A0AAE8YVN9_9CAUD|nr:putative structural protein [Bacillus phage vB_BanS_Sophrita]YP_010680048.1 putative structural protein [Bacillus phage pW2]AZU98934.1 putative structural protein [Bacillus phage pW2]UGO50808.1 putative structural protein [Bacillus phage vB_BanS_Sophrita]